MIVDSFGVINLEQEWARLDHFATQYRNHPGSKIFIVVCGGKVNKYGELKDRPKRLVNYLTENRKIESKEITVINGGFKEKFEMQLWLSSLEKIYSLIAPTINIENVRFRGKMKPLPQDLF